MQEITLPARLKKAEVCAQLGISARTLENLVASKQFPQGVRIGKWSYWSTKVLRDWHTREFAQQEAWRDELAEI